VIHDVVILFHILVSLKYLPHDSFISKYGGIWFVKLPSWKDPEPCHSAVTYSVSHTASVQAPLQIMCFLTKKEKLWWFMHMHTNCSGKMVVCYHFVLVLLSAIVPQYFLNAPVHVILERAVKT